MKNKLPMRNMVKSHRQFLFYCMPYVPVSGSLKIPISGVLKVKTINKTPIMQSVTSEDLGFLHTVFSLLSCRVSYIYDMAAEMKNIAIFIQSGEVPMTPLYV